jgi:hypothetical protein
MIGAPIYERHRRRLDQDPGSRGLRSGREAGRARKAALAATGDAGLQRVSAASRLRGGQFNRSAAGLTGGDQPCSRARRERRGVRPADEAPRHLRHARYAIRDGAGTRPLLAEADEIITTLRKAECEALVWRRVGRNARRDRPSLRPRGFLLARRQRRRPDLTERELQAFSQGNTATSRATSSRRSRRTSRSSAWTRIARLQPRERVAQAGAWTRHPELPAGAAAILG